MCKNIVEHIKFSKHFLVIRSKVRVEPDDDFKASFASELEARQKKLETNAPGRNMSFVVIFQIQTEANTLYLC